MDIFVHILSSNENFLEPQILNNQESAYTHRTKINENFAGLAEESIEAIERIADLESGKADKVTSATNNNFAALDANGNLKDSGVSASSFDATGSVAEHNTSTTAHSNLFSLKANKMTVLNGTLLASAWTTTIPYSQIVTIQGLKADDNIIVGMGDSNSASNLQYQVAASATLRAISQAKNSLTIQALGEKPTIDIPFVVYVFG